MGDLVDGFTCPLAARFLHLVILRVIHFELVSSNFAHFCFSQAPMVDRAVLRLHSALYDLAELFDSTVSFVEFLIG